MVRLKKIVKKQRARRLGRPRKIRPNLLTLQFRRSQINALIEVAMSQLLTAPTITRRTLVLASAVNSARQQVKGAVIRG
jgi:hypothetical protein